MLEAVGLNPSSTTSCLLDLASVGSVSLSLHICTVGRQGCPVLSAVAGLALTDFSGRPLLPFRARDRPALPQAPRPPVIPCPRCRRGAMSCVLTGVVPLGLVLLLCGAQGFFLPNVTQLEKLLSKYQGDQPHSRTRRAISRADREEILTLHNKLRGQVSPPASNMEYMVSVGPGQGAGPRPQGSWPERLPWLHLSELSPSSMPSTLPLGPPGVGVVRVTGWALASVSPSLGWALALTW